MAHDHPVRFPLTGDHVHRDLLTGTPLPGEAAGVYLARYRHLEVVAAKLWGRLSVRPEAHGPQNGPPGALALVVGLTTGMKAAHLPHRPRTHGG